MNVILCSEVNSLSIFIDYVVPKVLSYFMTVKSGKH
jgi:hypothetical protein